LADDAIQGAIRKVGLHVSGITWKPADIHGDNLCLLPRSDRFTQGPACLTQFQYSAR
jgi:hypothetical protein